MYVDEAETAEKVSTVFATSPVGLAKFPVFGREEALIKTFQLLFARWQDRRNENGPSDRNQNPFIFFPASFGLGKTRMLNILTRIPKRPADEKLQQFLEKGSNLNAILSDEELKWAVLERARRNDGNVRDSWVNHPPESAEEFCNILLTESAGIIITFNHRTNLSMAEREGKVRASEMLGIRVAFEAQLVPNGNYSDFESFCLFLKNVLGEERPTLNWALNQAFARFGDGKHIILGIDEVLLGAGIANYEAYLKSDQNRLLDILNALGVELDKRKNLHLVLTSLSYKYLADQITVLGRNAIAIHLPNLTCEESMALAAWYHADIGLPESRSWLHDSNAKQIVEDCDGAPRLLEHVFMHLKPSKSLEYLRRSCMQVEPISKLNAKADRLMTVALVLALRGVSPETDERSCFDEAVYMGYLLSSSVLDNQSADLEPIFPLMTMWCVSEKSSLSPCGQVYPLWAKISAVLRFDSDVGGNELGGKSFEAFFRALWSLRCLTRRYEIYNVNGTGATARFGARIILSMRSMLSSFDRVPDIASPKDEDSSVFDLHLDMDAAPTEVRFGGSRSPYTKVRHEDVYVVHPRHRILTPNNPNEPGLDNIMTFRLTGQRASIRGKRRNVGNQVAVFVFQFKFSVPTAATTISNEIIANAFIDSINNNIEVFKSAIEGNMFGYVFVSASPCRENVSTAQVAELVKQKVETRKDLAKAKGSILSALSHIAILKRDDVLKFIPRSFRSRPQFRLEREFAASIK